MKKDNPISKHFSEMGKKSWEARRKRLIAEARAALRAQKGRKAIKDHA